MRSLSEIRQQNAAEPPESPLTGTDMSETDGIDEAICELIEAAEVNPGTRWRVVRCLQAIGTRVHTMSCNYDAELRELAAALDRMADRIEDLQKRSPELDDHVAMLAAALNGLANRVTALEGKAPVAEPVEKPATCGECAWRSRDEWSCGDRLMTRCRRNTWGDFPEGTIGTVCCDEPACPAGVPRRSET